MSNCATRLGRLNTQKVYGGSSRLELAVKSAYPYMAFVPVILKFSSISFANASARLAALSASCDTSLSINTTTLAPSRRNQSDTCGDVTLFKVQRGSLPWMAGNPLGGIGVYSWSPYVGRFGVSLLFAHFLAALASILASMLAWLSLNMVLSSISSSLGVIFLGLGVVWDLSVSWTWLVSFPLLSSGPESDLGLLCGLTPLLFNMITS